MLFSKKFMPDNRNCSEKALFSRQYFDHGNAGEKRIRTFWGSFIVLMKIQAELW